MGKRFTIGTLAVLLAVEVCLGQPPPVSEQPVKHDPSNNWLPALSNGNPPNLPVGSKVNGVVIATGGDVASEQVNGSGTATITWTGGKTFLRQTNPLTASVVGFLPAASSFPAGRVITYGDSVTPKTAAYGVAWTPQGLDTINGGTDPMTVGTGPTTARFETDGVSAWTQLDSHLSITSIQDAINPAIQVALDVSAMPVGTSTIHIGAGTISDLLGTSTVRGIAKDVFISLRTDGKDGTGTPEDPYNGSTAALFDAVMASSTKVPANANIYLCGSGTYQSKGFAPRSGWKFHAGTATIQIPVLTSGEASAFIAIFGGTSAPLVSDILIEGGIWDLNMQNQTSGMCPAAIQLICDGLTIQNLKCINFGNNKSGAPEEFVIGNFSNGSRDGIIHRKPVRYRNIEFTGLAAGVVNTGTISLLNTNGGQNVTTNASLSAGWFEDVEATGINVHDIANSDNVAIDAINTGGWVKNFHGHHNKFKNITGINARYGYYHDTGSVLNMMLDHDEIVNVSTGIHIGPLTSGSVVDSLTIAGEMMDSNSSISIEVDGTVATVRNVNADLNQIKAVGSTGIYFHGVANGKLRLNTIDSSTSEIVTTGSTIAERYGNCRLDGTPVTGDSGVAGLATSQTFTGSNTFTGTDNIFRSAKATDGDLGYELKISDTTAYNSSPLSGLLFLNKYDSGGTYAGMGGIGVGKENTTDGNWSSYAALYTRLDGNSTAERLRVSSAGKVGIGTTDPKAYLQVRTAQAISAGSVPTDANILLSGTTAATSPIYQIRTTSYDDNTQYGTFWKSNYASGATLTLGTRDAGTDTDALTLKGANATIAGTITAGSVPTTITNAAGGLLETAMALTDVTTNNASTSNHGFLPKLDNTATHFLNGQGGWTTPSTTPGTGTVTDTMLASSVKPAVAVVATANLTLSGEQTIDGQLTSTSLVLATGQSTGSQNGPWISASGAWARPGWYTSGSTTQAPQFLTTFVRLGTTYQGSTWRMTTASVTIDTTSTTWVQTPTNINSVTGSLAESSVTNLVSDLALKAPLASPTLTGTPLAPTAGAGTNTTQIATTQFVTTAVPVAATKAQQITGTSTTVYSNPSVSFLGLLGMYSHDFTLSLASGSATEFNTSAVSGSGTTTIGNTTTLVASAGGTASSWAYRLCRIISSLWTGANNCGIDFSKTVGFSISFRTTSNTTNGLSRFAIGDDSGNANMVSSGSPNTGKPAKRAIGIEIRQLALYAMVHDGTTLTQTTLSTTLTAATSYHLLCIGSGGSYDYYLNGAKVGSTVTGGPATQNTTTNAAAQAWLAADNGADAADQAIQLSSFRFFSAP